MIVLYKADLNVKSERTGFLADSLNLADGLQTKSKLKMEGLQQTRTYTQDRYREVA